MAYEIKVVVSDEAEKKPSAPAAPVHRAGPHHISFPDSQHFGPGCRVCDFDSMSWFRSFF